jgi:hypothetical protein
VIVAFADQGIRDATLITVNTIELVSIAYLAIAYSRLRARQAYLEGRLNGKSQREEKE